MLLSYSPLIEQLIGALRCLPGVGPRSAQRMALHLLERNREGAQHLATTLERAVSEVGHCRLCRTLCEQDVCSLCANPRRDQTTLCVVEGPSDVFALEQLAEYRGLYFVLMGHLSPIDGIGPTEIGVDLLLQRVRDAGVREVILATNPTVEGEATAYYISEQVRALGVTVSRIAHGIPLGGELESIDSGTLAHALSGRRVLE